MGKDVVIKGELAYPLVLRNTKQGVAFCNLVILGEEEVYHATMYGHRCVAVVSQCQAGQRVVVFGKDSAGVIQAFSVYVKVTSKELKSDDNLDPFGRSPGNDDH